MASPLGTYQPRCIPSLSSPGWTTNLTVVPHISERTLEWLCDQKGPSARQRKKAYSFAIEAYCSPSSLRTNTCDSGLGIVHVHCTCFRSQKKSGRPYNVQLSVHSATGVPRTTTCECPAGKSGACSHILAAVRLLALLKQQGFAEPPPELSCTELPQQWRRPRQKGIKPASVLDVDWRAPREGGVQLPVTARLSDASLDYQDEASQVAAIQSLGAELEALGDFPFAAVLLDVQAPLVKTKAGLAPADSPLTYQQSDRPHDFKTWMSSTIAPGAGTSCALPQLALLTGAVQHTFPDVLTVDEQLILMTCSEAVIFLEREVHLCLRLEQLLLEDFTIIFKSVYFIALCGNHTLKTFHFTDRLATT
ncbi:hypothetical protein HPB49_004123 [Dermacentor silvarum]|uniref:Uncharacterized protein n=1 Tax=Dermacentor silvarum TaxID=543639 RepID=A0ACB8DTX2_DERSI|nr:hypothetical protein HPB49_004123 [Dermacentor silvarum]